MDEQSAKIILIEEDLRKEFRILEEENKKTDSNSLDNSIVAAVIKELLFKLLNGQFRKTFWSEVVPKVVELSP